MSKFAPSEPVSQVSTPAAQVSIDANVPNCDVEVDGTFAGNTPSEISPSTGTHKITVSQKGWAPWSKTVLVTSSGLHLRAELESIGSPSAASSASANTAQR